MFLYAFLKLQFSLFTFLMINYWILFTYQNLFELFSRNAEIYRTRKINVHILSSSAKSCWGHTMNTYILLFSIDSSTKLYRVYDLTKLISRYFKVSKTLKIYTNFFVSSVDYDFKIDYLKHKMRHGMGVNILLNNLA